MHGCITDLDLFTHALFVRLTNALINSTSYHALHAVDKVSALFLPNVACHTAYSSHKCCLSSLFRLTFFRFHLFIIYLLLPLPGIFSSIIFFIFLQCYYNFSPSFYNATHTLIFLASYYLLFPSVRLLFDSLNLPIAVLLSSEHWKEISSTACCNSICCSFFYRCRQCYRCCQCCLCC